jgi:hypothetical protein
MSAWAYSTPFHCAPTMTCENMQINHERHMTMVGAQWNGVE